MYWDIWVYCLCIDSACSHLDTDIIAVSTPYVCQKAHVMINNVYLYVLLIAIFDYWYQQEIIACFENICAVYP